MHIINTLVLPYPYIARSEVIAAVRSLPVPKHHTRVPGVETICGCRPVILVYIYLFDWLNI
jgi:hypothetical protein